MCDILGFLHLTCQT